MTQIQPSQADGPKASTPDTHQKALAVNLDPTSFGSFSEIGAGQEVARWFLRVGGASGTVAKTVCAYDKQVSDDLYGSGTRYVSKPRVQAMLESEWKALDHQVGQTRGATTRFFAFANTIAARNFSGTNDCHGWLGVRFQHAPQAQPSEIILHINLRDNTNLLQQEAVGVFGVNLIHALLIAPSLQDAIPATLLDNLGSLRVEVDQIQFSGDAFTGFDLRALHVSLARNAHAQAITLALDGQAIAANEFLYKKAVVIAPAMKNPREDLPSHAIAACIAELQRQVTGNEQVKGVLDLRLLPIEAEGQLTGAHLLDKSASLIMRRGPLFNATSFVRRYTQAPLRYAITLPTLMRLFDDARNKHLDGRLLDALARLFESDVKILAYPSRREDLQAFITAQAGNPWQISGTQPWITADQIRPAAPLAHLYDYLLATGFLVSMPVQ